MSTYNTDLRLNFFHFIIVNGFRVGGSLKRRSLKYLNMARDAIYNQKFIKILIVKIKMSVEINKVKPGLYIGNL